MSKTNELAIENGWDSKKLGDKIDSAFQPTMNGIESGQYESAKVAIERTIVAVADLKEALPHASNDDIVDTVAERIKRGKAYSRTSKMLGSIVLMLYRVGFTTAEAIDQLLERKNWQGLADRALVMTGPWDLIGRVYGAGIKCKLSDIRAEFRKLFNSAKSPHDVKKAIVELMLGFTIAERTFELWIIGQSEQVKLSDGTEFKKHIASALERYESAKAEDNKAHVAGNASDTASALKLNVDTIKAENVVYLETEAAELKAKQEKAEAAAKEKAEAENVRKQALANQRKAEADQKRIERAEAEVTGLQEQFSAGSITAIELHSKSAVVYSKAEMTEKAEASLQALEIAKAEQAQADLTEASVPENQIAAHQTRKAEASQKRSNRRAQRDAAKDSRIAA